MHFAWCSWLPMSWKKHAFVAGEKRCRQDPVLCFSIISQIPAVFHLLTMLLRLPCHIRAVIMQLGQPQPGFANHDVGWVSLPMLRFTLPIYQRQKCYFFGLMYRNSVGHSWSTCWLVIWCHSRHSSPAGLYVMAALHSRMRTCIFSSRFFLFSSPNLSGRRLDIYLLPHMVMVWSYCKFRTQVWNVVHAARWKYRPQKITISAPSHNFVGLCLYI